ncbi:alpha/beta hydrolase fold-domain-containing protein [Durotheca rogersii]|uniref:alpha/beta hydrolase fold-domain-containing protein n=1 Tax=Durotheca rogersii TaxID=419775 RepID=UPI00221E47F6|nr:alpha/beta hydrolase fold-domain-containing protein [Durotheca rogersii]KAI5859367.1 alpha/beta hydrolase fold-domain-containing protein [Durotheca rogersii]
MTRSITITRALLALASLASAKPITITVPGAPSFGSGSVPDGLRPRQEDNSTGSGASVGSISFGRCPNSFPEGVTCGKLVVPLDWDTPLGNETIELGLVRREATDRANRIGNLFLNPGGPGGQASNLVAQIAAFPQAVDSRLLERFDLIGLDPRGVGLSTPIRCDPAVWNKRVSFFPQTQEAFDELVAHNRAAGESCRARTGRLIDFVDTISAARDHEAVRLALGGEPANYLGLSYGTQLFAQVAELFPDSFRAMVLDGNLQHSQSESANVLAESTTFQSTLKEFFRWCFRSRECAFRSRNHQFKFQRLVQRASEAPIRASGCDNRACRSDVSVEELLFSTQLLLTSVTAWPQLGQALQDANGGDATLLSQIQPLAIGDAYVDSNLFAGTAVTCQDWAHEAQTLADVRAKVTLGSTFNPLTLGSCQMAKIQTACIGWPAPLTNPPKPTEYAGSTPILVVQSTLDPSTSLSWGLGLHEELGPVSSLLTRNGTGHTSFLLGGGETVGAISEYLLSLGVPADGTVLNS